MKQKNLFNGVWDMPYGRTTPYHLFDAAKNSREFVQKLQLQKKIPVHEGCVNSICWNSNGKYLLSGSDDQRLSIVHGYDYSVLAYIQTGHRANIFSAKFLPNTGDSHVVSCSGDGIIIYSDLERPNTSLTNKFNCHRGTAYEIMTVPNDSHTFLSCGEDRSVRWFDVRTKTSCSKEDCKEDILINCLSPVTSLAVNPLTPYQLAVGCADASVRIFDRRMLCTYNTSGFSAGNGYGMGLQALMTCFTVPELAQSRRITSLCYSSDGQEMLVSYSSDYIYLFDIKDDFEKKPKTLSKEGTSKEANLDGYYTEVFVPKQPLMKRLRIRGDWSDTGPNARPEAEAREMDEESSRSRIVRTMTNIISRVFSNLESRRSDISESSSASSEGDGNTAPDTSATAEQSPIAAWRSRRRLMASQASEEPTSKRRGRSDNSADSTNESSASNSKCSKVTDPNTPSTSSAFVDGGCASTADSAPGPSSSVEESCSRVSVYKVDKDKNVNKKKSKDSSVEKELESNRKDLVEKHDAEPMVTSGQGVTSGQITVDEASSSTANERLWQQTAPDLTSDLVSQETETATPEAQGAPASPSQSEVDAGMESIQPNEDLLPLISNIGTVAGSSSVQAESSREGQGGEVEIMMEDDSWEDMESEDEQRPAHARRRSSERVLCNFMDSFSDDVRKAENHMPTVTQPRVKKKFTGHRNARTMIKESTFWGDNFVMSGSDCGHIFIWDRHTTELVMLMEADHHVVNCLQPHPFDPILASSGIDYDIKLWAPSREEPFFDQEKANEIIKRNEIMLEETQDTITVPASFMFRVFSTINNIRRDRRLGLLGRDMWTANSNDTDP